MGRTWSGRSVSLPAGWRATLNAVDGAVIADLPQQLQRLPADASHLVVSVGGNDALGEAALLDQKVGSVAEALELITQVRERFCSGYARMLDQVLNRRLPLAVSSIYEPRFPEPLRRRLAATALNDAITREAFARKVDCIDLRLICDDDRDFANPIEPSIHGGAKIARAILRGDPAAPTEGRPRVLVCARRHCAHTGVSGSPGRVVSSCRLASRRNSFATRDIHRHLAVGRPGAR